MSEKKIRGGSLIARALKDKGIQHVFTLSGGFCNPALEGFMECQMEVINCPHEQVAGHIACLLYTSPSPRDGLLSRMPSSA